MKKKLRFILTIKYYYKLVFFYIYIKERKVIDTNISKLYIHCYIFIICKIEYTHSFEKYVQSRTSKVV